MHPVMQFDWWIQEPQDWEKDIAAHAKATLTNIWNNQYKPDQPQATTEQSNVDDGIGHAVSVAELDFIGAPELTASSSRYQCELKEYVAAKYAGVLPLEFWKQHDVQATTGLPNLAKMTHDYLAIPATSASSE